MSMYVKKILLIYSSFTKNRWKTSGLLAKIHCSERELVVNCCTRDMNLWECYLMSCSIISCQTCIATFFIY